MTIYKLKINKKLDRLSVFCHYREYQVLVAYSAQVHIATCNWVYKYCRLHFLELIVD